MVEVVALSGGKDSVAMAYRLEEIDPNPGRIFLHTPTGDELPPMVGHITRLDLELGGRLVFPPAPTLRELIDSQQCLPNWRMRWCTRMIKIEPCLEYLRTLDNPTLLVGLRADEDARQGLYDEHVNTRFPLREWGWGLDDVWDYLKHKNITIPERTDCARCYYQRLIDWWRLWKQYPDIYLSAMQDEKETGYTYRSPSKDKHPTSLLELACEFNKGWIPTYRKRSVESRGGCRVCSM